MDEDRREEAGRDNCREMERRNTMMKIQFNSIQLI